MIRAIRFPLLSSPKGTLLSLARSSWWKRFRAVCASVACPHRKKLLPSILLRSLPGIFFEGRWYCEPGCLVPVLEFRLRGLLSGSVARKARSHRLPLGLLLVDRGVISPEQLREALRLQRQAGGVGRLGDWLHRLGVVTEQQLAAALGQQWGCAFFPLDYQAAHPSWSGLLPFPLLDYAHAVPAHASQDGRVLHLAFGERLDHPLLYAIERMLDCHTIACVAAEAKILEFLSHWRHRGDRTDISFDTIRDAREVAWIVGNYANELQALRVAVARTSSHIWVRLFRSRGTRDLLFRMPPASASPAPLEKFVHSPKAFSPPADTRKDGVSDAVQPL